MFLSPPSYSGAFIGRAEKAELYTSDGKAFPVTKFMVESTRGRIKAYGNPRIPWKPERRDTVFLADHCGTAYPPDTYAGKILNVTGRLPGYGPCPFPNGPLLLTLPMRSADAQRVLVLTVDSIEVVVSGTPCEVAAKFVAPTCSKRPNRTSACGSWRGHFERFLLNSSDGRAFPALGFKMEMVQTRTKFLPIAGPTVILVNHCYIAYLPDTVDPTYTAYPPTTYAGQYGGVSGTIEDGSAFPFPGGPRLSLSTPSGSDLGQDRIAVLVVNHMYVRK